MIRGLHRIFINFAVFGNNFFFEFILTEPEAQIIYQIHSSPVSRQSVFIIFYLG